uniref:Uncharacterized protein n=1 Tax=Aegilops tauschii subsp. strangulata TaxID=200361 RepID=A0A453CHU0_AEGTS
ASMATSTSPLPARLPPPVAELIEATTTTRPQPVVDRTISYLAGMPDIFYVRSRMHACARMVMALHFSFVRVCIS